MRRILFFFIFCNIAFGQQNHNQVIKSLKDSINLYRHSNPDKALNFGFEVLKIADFSNPTFDLVAVHSKIGEILYYRGLYSEAIGFYNESLKLHESLPLDYRIEKKITNPPWLLLNIGNIYFANNDYDNAAIKYNEALANFKLFENTVTKNYGFSTVYDNLGSISENKGDFKLAEEYYLRAYDIRKKNNKIEDLLYSEMRLMRLNMKQNNMFNVNKHFIEIERLYSLGEKNFTGNDYKKSYETRNYGYAYSYMGKYYLKISEYKVAKEFFYAALQILSSFPSELPILNSKIAECYLGLKKYDDAIVVANKNLNSIELNLFINAKNNNYKVLEKVYQERGDLNNLINVKDSLLFIAKAMTSINNSNKMSDLETNIILSKKRSEINDNRIKYNTYLFILIICFVILFFTLISLRLNFNVEKEKSKKIFNEKLLIENDLNHKKLELLNKSNFSANRNKNLNFLLEVVENSEKVIRNQPLEIKRKIEGLIKYENMADRFEKHFEDVYPGFFKSLIAVSTSNLTQNDLRLCAYLKMNHGTDEIAQLTGVSVRTVESKKYRLKKKFNFNKDQTITTFIHGI